MFKTLAKSEQNTLLCLAPFISVIWKPILNEYIKKLNRYEPILKIDISSLNNIMDKMEKIGLLKESESECIVLHPAMTCFLKNCLLDKQRVKALIEDAYVDYYLEDVFPLIVLMMNSDDSDVNQKGKYILKNEYKNISSVMNLSIIQNKSMKRFLDIMKCTEEECLWASIYYHLKVIVLKEQEYEQAKIDYKNAMEEYISNGDNKNREEMYHRLALIAQKKSEYEEAKKYNMKLRISS